MAKDRVAVFWFLAACAVAGGCAWYLAMMAKTLNERPPFVVMDSSGAYYVEAGVNFEQAKPMHLALTELAVETLFDRTPTGLVNPDRLPRLCDRDGLAELRAKIREEDSYFVGQQVRQTVQVEKVEVLIPLATAVRTGATGLLTRDLTFKGQSLTEQYTFTVWFNWHMNPDMRDNQAYPAVIYSMPFYELKRISQP
ncbi:MAG TPA: hypothetical protein VD994_15290 [Prosthecobacter sp.]|nr:hypothetical protein [Prosthecobacter sp.]